MLINKPGQGWCHLTFAPTHCRSPVPQPPPLFPNWFNWTCHESWIQIENSLSWNCLENKISSRMEQNRKELRNWSDPCFWAASKSGTFRSVFQSDMKCDLLPNHNQTNESNHKNLFWELAPLIDWLIDWNGKFLPGWLNNWYINCTYIWKLSVLMALHSI